MIKAGKLIRACREYNQLSQTELGMVWGVDTGTINRWENFKTEPSFFDVCGIIEDVFKLTIQQAMEIADDDC